MVIEAYILRYTLDLPETLQRYPTKVVCRVLDWCLFITKNLFRIFKTFMQNLLLPKGGGIPEGKSRKNRSKKLQKLTPYAV